MLGKYLAWVKAEVGHGKFLPWLNEHVKAFSQQTASNFMRFAAQCEETKTLLIYEPGKLPIIGNLELTLRQAKEIKAARRAERIAEATQEGRKERRAAEGEVRKVLIQEGLAVRFDGGKKVKDWCR